MIIQIGIDEAGRGCAIGPLVMAAVAVYPGQDGLLLNWNVRDSKELEPFTINILNQRITRHLSHEMQTIPADDIDLYVDKGKLNEVCRIKAGQLIVEMASTHLVNPLVRIEFYLDGHNVFDGIQTQISRFAQPGHGWGDIDWSRVDLIVEDHADSKYRCVSAASILAKYERDRHISNIMSPGKGIPKGSGYCNEYTATWIIDELTRRLGNGMSLQQNLKDMQVRLSFKWTQDLIEKI